MHLGLDDVKGHVLAEVRSQDLSHQNNPSKTLRDRVISCHRMISLLNTFVLICILVLLFLILSFLWFSVRLKTQFLLGRGYKNIAFFDPAWIPYVFLHCSLDSCHSFCVYPYGKGLCTDRSTLIIT